MANTKYTFLLPAYKGQFLDDMLRSIQGQTYTDFKVIISDDCSPEDLRRICEPYLEDPRFRYRRNQENMGSKSLVSHWNLLIKMCDTEFLILSSDDDIYEPFFLEEMDKLTRLHKEVDLFRGRVKRIDALSQTIEIENPSDEFEQSLNAAYSHFQSTRVHCISNYLFKTVKLQQTNGFVDFPLAWFSDDATVLNCLQNGICNTPSVCFNFRDSGTNISNDQKVTIDNAINKIKATRLFYVWYQSYINQFDNFNDINDKYLLKEINKRVLNRIKYQLRFYYPFVSRNDKIKLLKWMHNNGIDYNNKKQLIKAFFSVVLNFKA